jgi:L-ribulose-5-phosphate 3-epimerase
MQDFTPSVEESPCITLPYQETTMTDLINRRDFLTTSALTAAGVTMAGAHPKQEWKPKKAVLYDMLQGSMEDRFKIARDVGFEGVEAPRCTPHEAEKYRVAADKAGIHIHSIIFGGWDAPLSSPDSSVIERGTELVKTNLHSAQIMGCEGILLVPAVVNAKVRYIDAYKNSQQNIKRLIPEAEKRKVKINIEEVWNNFLLSPLEMAHYIDEFRSPWIQSYFDVGNVIRFAWPQDWIRTLGKRIQKVHIKDFKGGPGLGTGGQWVNLHEGSIDWKEVRAAFMEVGFTGFMTTELNGGDTAYLRDISARVDRIIAGT